MIFKEVIQGKNIRLRSAEEKDAAFIVELRLNPRIRGFIGKTDPSVEKQEQWIEEKRALSNDYHMIIESLDGTSQGTIAVYDIDFVHKRAEWGRWVIQENAGFFIAFESAVLMYHFAFNTLNLKELYFGVQNQNTKVINFHKEFGSKITKQDHKEIWFTFDQTCLDQVLRKYRPFHSLPIKEN
ncbi:MAG: GNAT family N-acetyltransferase [Candidatus Omnitrophica bacterium]|nr:GNAT family N-acetyltransferase [Candidatus Omnitrophota bacterium]